jgi:hypothetical protein
MEKDWNKKFVNAVKNFKKQIIVEMKEPPCKFCKYFTAVYETDSSGDYTGIRICHGERMCYDFTCFELDETK